MSAAFWWGYLFGILTIPILVICVALLSIWIPQSWFDHDGPDEPEG